jgi:hypothetical protein
MMEAADPSKPFYPSSRLYRFTSQENTLNINRCENMKTQMYWTHFSRNHACYILRPSYSFHIPICVQYENVFWLENNRFWRIYISSALLNTINCFWIVISLSYQSVRTCLSLALGCIRHRSLPVNINVPSPKIRSPQVGKKNGNFLKNGSVLIKFQKCIETIALINTAWLMLGPKYLRSAYIL